MIWIIARRQLLDYLITWRFGLVLAISTVLVVLGTSLQVATLEEQLEDYEARQHQLRQETGDARTFNEVRLGVGRRPPMLGFLCAGQDQQLPHFATTGILYPPLEALGVPTAKDRFWYIGWGAIQTFARQNPLMRGLRKIDFAFAVATFLSLLAFLLSFDSISGERETGTLFLVIANSVSRGAILLGKLLGGMGCLAISLAVALNAALIVGLQSPRIALGTADWIAVGLLFAVSLLFLSGLFILGMVVSCWTDRPSTSLVVLLLIWTVAVALIPNAAPYAASLLREMPSESEYARKYAETSQSLQEMLDELGHRSPPPSSIPMGADFVNSERISGFIPYARKLSWAPREAVDWYITGTEEGNRFLVDSIDEQWKLFDVRFVRLLSQRDLAEWLGRFSPVFSFSNLAERIAGTHPSVGVRFARQAKQFHDLLIAFARQEGGLGLRFFTPLKREDFHLLVDYQQLWDAGGMERIREIYEEKYEKTEPVQGLPVFRFRPESPLDAALHTDLILLILLPALFFIWGFFTFIHREEAGRP